MLYLISTFYWSAGKGSDTLLIGGDNLGTLDAAHNTDGGVTWSLKDASFSQTIDGAVHTVTVGTGSFSGSMGRTTMIFYGDDNAITSTDLKAMTP